MLRGARRAGAGGSSYSLEALGVAPSLELLVAHARAASGRDDLLRRCRGGDGAASREGDDDGDGAPLIEVVADGIYAFRVLSRGACGRLAAETEALAAALAPGAGEGEDEGGAGEGGRKDSLIGRPNSMNRHWMLLDEARGVVK